MLRKSFVALIVAGVMFGGSAYADLVPLGDPMPYDWLNPTAFGGQPVLGFDGNPIAVGSGGGFLQLVLDAGGDGPDPLDLGNPLGTGAGGDDIVIAVGLFGSGGTAAGEFWMSSNIDSDLTGDMVFVRAFDQPSLAFTGGMNDPIPLTGYYDDSPQMDDLSNGELWFLNQGWQTLTPVPEPGTLMLFAVGLITLGVRRKRR